MLKSVCERVNGGEYRRQKLPTEEEKVALDSVDSVDVDA